MKSIILTIITAIFGSLQGIASEKQSMVLLLKNGDTVSYLLEDYPEIILEEDGTMFIGVDAFKIADVALYSFSGITSAINQIPTPSPTEISFSITGKYEITISGVLNDCYISLYDINGIPVDFRKERIDENRICISLQPLSSGLYILSAGQKAIKIKR